MTDEGIDQETEIDEEESIEKNAPSDRETAGPLDDSEAPVRPYIDLGGMRIVPRQGLQMRLEVEERTKRVVAVTLELEGSTLQLQPFAAPRSEGIWGAVRPRLAEQLGKQGATVTEGDGPLGPELRGELPAGADGTPREVRIVGVDGPRWMLQGLIAGKAVTDEAAMTEILDVYRSTVVVRGQEPMPPRDLIPLVAPKTA